MQNESFLRLPFKVFHCVCVEGGWEGEVEGWTVWCCSFLFILATFHFQRWRYKERTKDGPWSQANLSHQVASKLAHSPQVVLIHYFISNASLLNPHTLAQPYWPWFHLWNSRCELWLVSHARNLAFPSENSAFMRNVCSSSGPEEANYRTQLFTCGWTPLMCLPVTSSGSSCCMAFGLHQKRGSSLVGMAQ